MTTTQVYEKISYVYEDEEAPKKRVIENPLEQKSETKTSEAEEKAITNDESKLANEKTSETPKKPEGDETLKVTLTTENEVETEKNSKMENSNVKNSATSEAEAEKDEAENGALPTQEAEKEPIIMTKPEETLNGESADNTPANQEVTEIPDSVNNGTEGNYFFIYNSHCSEKYNFSLI